MQLHLQTGYPICYYMCLFDYLPHPAVGIDPSSADFFQWNNVPPSSVYDCIALLVRSSRDGKGSFSIYVSNVVLSCGSTNGTGPFRLYWAPTSHWARKRAYLNDGQPIYQVGRVHPFAFSECRGDGKSRCESVLFQVWVSIPSIYWPGAEFRVCSDAQRLLSSSLHSEKAKGCTRPTL
jgi:hypothetical protein